MTAHKLSSLAAPLASRKFRRPSQIVRWCALLLFTLLAACASASAQGNVTSPTDGMTPLQLQPGAPEGSYALSGFDNVNLYNGNLNFDLPLLKVGGRGGIGYTVQLPLEIHWQILDICTNGMQTCSPAQTLYSPIPVGDSFHHNPQAVLSMYGRYANAGPITISGNDNPITGAIGWQCTYYTEMLTRLTVVNADGSETELRDALTDGQPLSGGPANQCSTVPSRGTIFKSSDGSAMTFISDTTIYDMPEPPSSNRNVPMTGYLLTRDGTRYRIEGGVVKWMQDRNGNKIDFAAGTDSLGRALPTTTSHYDGNGNHTSDTITFAGTDGAPRTITINYANLDAVLRPDYLLQSYHGLFPNLNGATTYNTFDPSMMVASVTLPNNQQYQFKYNSYGELARVDLPSGGRIEYDFNGAYSSQTIIRAVQARRVYSDAGVTLTGSTTYSYAHPDSPPATITTVDHLDANGALLAREKHYYHGYVGDNPAVGSDPTAYEWWQDGHEYQTEEYAADGTTVLRSSVQQWQQRVTTGWWTNTPGRTAPPEDPRVFESDTTIEPGGANLVTKQTFSYDDSVPYNNRSDVYEYDFGNGAAGALKRHTHTDYQTATSYVDAQMGAHIRDLPTATYVKDASDNTVAQSTMAYDEYGLQAYASVTGWTDPGATTVRGNLTSASSWVNTTNSWLTSHVHYDQVGNPIQHTDARGINSAVDYTDHFSDGQNRNTYAFPTSSTSAVPDSTGAHGSATAFTMTAQYDYATGRITAQTDANGQTSTLAYNDALDRPTQLVRAVGTGQQSQTTVAYDDANHLITTTSDQATLNDNALKSQTLYDGLGRTTETRAYETATSYITTAQQYDALGRVRQSSIPYRTGETVVWTTTGYDALGRVVSVTTPDGAVVTTSYSGNQVLVTDQAGRKRSSVTDALGRLTSVTEDPTTGGLNYQTSYAYDTLDNLTQVTQGAQTRTFVYDSLKRLTSATNPESGTIAYQYDNDGNLTQKTDARSVTTTYAYDQLNRVTTRSYSDSTPAVTYSYDTLTNGKGRLTSVSSSVSTTSYGQYDVMGRVTQSTQTTDGQSYQMSYAYNLAGALTAQTYPSGRVITTGYDSAGRINSVSGQMNTTTTPYASQFTYTAHGAVTEMKLGNGLWEHMIFNARLQPQLIGLGTVQTLVNPQDLNRFRIDYSYGTTNNNGNVQQQTISVPDTSGTYVMQATQSYSYDALNRLQSAVEINGATQNWKQTYVYDRWDNRTFDAANTTSPNPLQNPSINASNNNRIDAGQGYGYDVAGNLTSAPSQTFGYDAENHQVNYQGGNLLNGGATYSYDGDGRRVKKVTASGTTIFVYDAGGQMVAEYSTISQPGSGGTSYLTADSLGTPRVITDASGNVKARHDYLPFGEELGLVGGRTAPQGYVVDNVNQKFTQKERDGETGLDYFGARYYSSPQGRFTSVDPGPLMPAAPQSWNRYAYVENNPLKFIDPTGRKLELGGQAAQDFIDYLKKRSGGLDLILKNGKVSIEKNSIDTKNPAEKAFRDALKKVIGASEIVKLNVERDAPDNLVDDTVTAHSQNRTAVADMDDIESIDKQAPSLAAALTVHFLYEGLRFAQGSPGDVGEPSKYGFEDINSGAHVNALALEAKIMAAFTGQNEGKIAEHRDKDLYTKGVLNVIYTTVQFDVEVKSGATPHSDVVGKVTQTTPMRKPVWPPGP